MTNPDNFENPTKFDPTRWMKNPALERGKGYVPFGVGPRICVGRQLAETEARLIVGNFFQRFHLVPASGSPIPYDDGTLFVS